MEYSELHEKDKGIGAFSEFVGMEQAKKYNLVPEDYQDVFPDRCECGSEMIVKTNLRRVMCADPRCRIKLAYNFRHMLQQFNCKHVGEQSCLDIMRYSYAKLKLKSHLELLSFTDADLPPYMGGMAMYHFFQAVTKMKATRMSFGVMISNLGIPGFDSTALKIFSKVENLNDFLTKAQAEGGIANFLSNRGVEDRMRVFNLVEYLPDIAMAETQIFGKPLAVGKIEVSIVITGNISLYGRAITKSAYVGLCNKVGELSPSVRLFDVRRNSAVQSTAYLIAEGPSSNSKYLEVSAREASERRKLIYTPLEFIDHLKSIVTETTGKVFESKTL
jgi:hypothetical protein